MSTQSLSIPRSLIGEYRRALTVMVDNVGDNGLYVYCKCYCGNYRYIPREDFQNGKYRTCGCPYDITKLCRHLVAKQVYRWTILDYNDHTHTFRAQCSCGTIAEVARDRILYNRSHSCGCLRRENVRKAVRKDLVGKRFGKLTVIESLPQYDKWGAAYFKCKCDCGNYHIARGRHLIVGYVSSCGCLVSIGNMLVKKALTELNVEYISEHRVNLANNSWGKFDFYVPKYNLMIEFDGKQHFGPEKMYSDKDDASAEARFKQQQLRDHYKDKYCIDNGYNMLRIPYWEQNNVSNVIRKHLQRLSEKAEQVITPMQQSELTL